MVLIQHNIVQFTTNNENGTDRTYYVCNAREVLGVLRIGKIMWWASEEISSEAAAIVKYVAIQGKVKAGELSSVFKVDEVSDNTVDFESLLMSLVKRRILRVAHVHECMPIEDYKQSIRNEELQIMKSLSMPETKKAKEIEERLHRKLNELADENNSADSGLKRKAETQGNGPAAKKLKRTDSQAVPIVDPDVMLRLNHDKYLVYQRNLDLVELCQARLGETTAAVYKYILKDLEPKIFSCDQDTTSLVFTTLKLGNLIPRTLDLASVWADPAGRSNVSAQARLDDELDDEDILDGPNSDDENFIEHDINEDNDKDDYVSNNKAINGTGTNRLNLVNRFLVRLASDSLHFVRKVGTKSMGEWQVDFNGLSNVLKQLEIERVIQHKFGDQAPRLLHILREKKKLDEKQFVMLAFLKQKDIRHVLTCLHQVGVVDLQEVPKKLSERISNTTLFLWFHNQRRAISCLSQDLCKANARVHQRLAFEIKNRQRLLDKSQRTDVRNKEAEYLSKGELQELRKIRLIEDLLLRQSGRLAHAYSVLVEY